MWRRRAYLDVTEDLVAARIRVESGDTWCRGQHVFVVSDEPAVAYLGE